ncbi:ankyrin repeat-containing domain protein [Baffinella frigidus]|nr:ankyrin repeat-containing domain protein [Cryptophyta sp. CCMP2293]
MFGSVEGIAALIDGGADVHAADLGGLTPLHIACEKGKGTAAVCLLRHGAPLDVVDSIGRTALDWARAKEREEVVEAVGAWCAEQAGS